MKTLATKVVEDLIRAKWGRKTLQSAIDLKLFLAHAKRFVAREFPNEMVFDALVYSLFCLFGDVPLKIQRKALAFYLDIQEEKERDEHR